MTVAAARTVVLRRRMAAIAGSDSGGAADGGGGAHGAQQDPDVPPRGGELFQPRQPDHEFWTFDDQLGHRSLLTLLTSFTAGQGFSLASAGPARAARSPAVSR